MKAQRNSRSTNKAITKKNKTKQKTVKAQMKQDEWSRVGQQIEDMAGSVKSG